MKMLSLGFFWKKCVEMEKSQCLDINQSLQVSCFLGIEFIIYDV